MRLSTREEIVETIHLIGIKVILAFLILWVIMFLTFISDGDFFLAFMLLINLLLFTAVLVLQDS